MNAAIPRDPRQYKRPTILQNFYGWIERSGISVSDFQRMTSAQKTDLLLYYMQNTTIQLIVRNDQDPFKTARVEQPKRIGRAHSHRRTKGTN